MSDKSVDLNACLKMSIELYKKNFLFLLVVSVISTVLMVASLGLMAGPVIAGALTVVLKLIRQKEDVCIEEMFSRRDIFLPTFLAYLMWVVIVVCVLVITVKFKVFGSLISSVAMPAVFITNILPMYIILLILDKNLDLKNACQAAIRLVKKDVWQLLGFSAVASLVGFGGALVAGIGVVFTISIYFLMMATAYLQSSEGVEVSDNDDEDAPVVDEFPAYDKSEYV